MIDRKKWGLPEYKKPRKKAEEIEQEQDGQFFEHPSICAICDYQVTLKIFKPFRDSYLSGFDQLEGGRVSEKDQKAYDKLIKTMRQGAICNRCADARMEYVTAVESIENIANWLTRHFDAATGMSKADEDDQKKKQNILMHWMKKWSEALRRMNMKVETIYCDEMAGIIWKRPYAVNFFLDLIEQKIYNNTKPHEQYKQIQNIWHYVQR